MSIFLIKGSCVAVQKQVETAADIVTELMEDINRELFVASAVADITRTRHSYVLCAVPKQLLALSTAHA